MNVFFVVCVRARVCVHCKCVLCCVCVCVCARARAGDNLDGYNRDAT